MKTSLACAAALLFSLAALPPPLSAQNPTTVMVGVPEKPEFDHPASTIYYLVPDIDVAHATLRGRAVEFISEPHLVHRAADYELWLADFRDSEGNVLALMARKRRA